MRRYEEGGLKDNNHVKLNVREGEEFRRKRLRDLPLKNLYPQGRTHGWFLLPVIIKGQGPRETKLE